ncbi:hypothetical protein SCUCBS95973_003457 [Sporothrix curviconia]|uniref:Uncharacterized protein n=1 Tax=Sporothrix curviconia TaxID=1260050 RepID=A0ABP0BFJ9_9PEZI
MAAEIDANTPVEAPAISEPQAVHKSSDDLHNGGSNLPSVNGTATSGSPDELANKHIADIVDDLVNSAEPSISGGSDTEASRLDPAKRKDGGDKGHVRTSSAARKPATFKSVSVNKTFLAAKAGGAPGVAKPGDKASPTLGVASLSTPSSSASARPRLVAKTGLVKGAGANGRPAAAPDPNVVWNKNRPAAPVPEPRKLTDEELKKYGIHISSRLQQEDDAKGQNNWADIDDDDEDWAPEEITWTDGTKSTIPHHDEVSQPSPQPHGIQPDLSHTQLLAAAVQPSPTAPVSLLAKEIDAAEKPKSPAPTGVRIGGLPSGRGLILKGATEKPTLVAKPPAPPTPVKSPWASLPPVDKASPVTMDLPPVIGSTRMPYQQQHQFHQYPPRDMYGGPPPRGHSPPPAPFKEIAADDFSRGGYRDSHSMNRELFNSQSGRLEPVTDRRGSTRSDMHYRQPPSAVLQRQSNSLDQQQPEPSAAFQTHRSSAQEGPYGRRRNSSNVSGGSGSFLHRLGRPHDQSIPPELQNTQQPSLGGRSNSPASPRNYSPSGTRSWQTRGSPAATFASPYSNAAHGASPNTAHAGGPHAVQGPPQAAPPSIEEELEIQKKIMRERRELAKKRRLEEEEREEAAKRERIRLKLEAMGPAPERKSAKKETSKEEPAAATATPVTPLQANAQLSTPGDGDVAARLHPDNSSGPTAQTPGSRNDGAVDPAAAHRQPQAQQQQQQTWQSPVQPQNERIASWGSSNQAARNVWGSPNNRSLGNGTFNSDLGPIGPPSAQKNTSGPSIAPIGPPKTTVSLPPPPPPPPPPTAVQGTAAHAAVVAPVAGGNSPGATRSAWANAVKASDEAVLVQQKAHREEQQREAEARGLSLKDLRPTIKDTWMPTRMNEEGNRVEDKSNQSVVHRPGNTVGGSSSPSSTIHSQQPRPSRFFPTRDVRLEEAVAAAAHSKAAGGNVSTANHDRPGSPSPPPPDMDGHPAFDGDAAHPHVSLPKPQIVVRLPPKGGSATGPAAAAGSQQQQQQQQQQKTLPRNAASQSSHSQPTPSDGASWQAKFNNLFDRKSVASPSKPTSGANRFDSHAQGNIESTRATTKAPPSRSVKPVPKELPTTRLMAEDCFERQEMGSLPPVHLPNKVPELAWTPAAVPKPLARRFILSTATSGDHEGFLKDYFGAPHAVSIHFPGMSGAAKSVNLPTPRTNSNSRRSGYSRSGSGRHGSSSHRRSNKGRDASSTHSGSHGSEKATPPSTRQGSSGGRSRGGGMRHRSENWTRGTPAPVQT